MTEVIVSQSDTADDPTDDGRHVGPVIVAFALIFALIGTDVVIDYGTGATWTHLVSELVVMGLSGSGGVFMWHRLTQARRRVAVLTGDVATARQEAERWRAEAADLLGGLWAAIDRQFDRWQLTEAEREVALLLLKGLSHKQVAARRDTSERTVRQQAQSVYQKSGLDGRSALAAFFLEGVRRPPGGRERESPV
jgi:DNA-binding CsgD family transcriptional regulator